MTLKISKDKLPNGGIFRVLSTIADVLITFIAVQYTYQGTLKAENVYNVDVDTCNCSEFNMIPTTRGEDQHWVLIGVMILYGLLCICALCSRIFTLTALKMSKKKENCSCECTVKFILKLGHGFVYIAAGLLYIYGDNVKETYCDKISTVGNTTLCGAFIPRMMAGNDQQQEEKERKCNETADFTLGIALILNALLYLVEKSESCAWIESWRKDKDDDDWKKPIKRTRWMIVLSHLSSVSIADQVLSVTQSNFLSDENSNQCNETTKIFGWIAFSFIVAVMIGIICHDLPLPCFKARDRTKDSCKIVSFIMLWGLGIGLMFSIGLYLSADMPFPWDCDYECKHSQPQYIRRNLLAASLPLVFILTALHIVIVDIFSFCAQVKTTGQELPWFLEVYELEDA